MIRISIYLFDSFDFTPVNTALADKSKILYTLTVCIKPRACVRAVFV